MRLEISGDAAVVSGWKQFFDDERKFNERLDAKSKAKESCQSPVEFAVCNSLSVGDVCQVCDDVLKGRISRIRVIELANTSHSLGVLCQSKLRQLIANLDSDEL